MDIAPSNIEVCLKLNRFVCGEAENDVVALSDAHVRILSSHELGTLMTVAFSDGAIVSSPPSKQPTQRDLPKSNVSLTSEPKERLKVKQPQQTRDQNAVFIDGTTEEIPKRNPSKFLQMLNQERKTRWSFDQSALPIDGAEPLGAENSSRISKGMHSPPKFESAALNPLRQEQVVAKQLRDEMFKDILAQQKSQDFAENLSQVSGMSAKEKILRTGHATGIPDNLRQL